MAKSDPNLLTQAEYARSRNERGLPGGSREAVRKAVDGGRISAFGSDKLLDRALADSQWARNTRARVSAGDAGRSGEPGADLLSAAPGAVKAEPTASNAPAPDGYTAARARTEQANAGLAELQLARLRGEVRDMTDIKRGGFDIAREVRDALDSSVNTLAAELAEINNADACANVLRRHNRTIQEMLAKSLREKLSVTVEPV
jgi:phage terminase Nu1 subunit (DNA packaging protein)